METIQDQPTTNTVRVHDWQQQQPETFLGQHGGLVAYMLFVCSELFPIVLKTVKQEAKALELKEQRTRFKL